MLTDSSWKTQKRNKNRSVMATTNRHWSDKQKLETVQTFLMLGGNIQLTSSTVKIPEATIFAWKKTEWWNDLVSEFKKEERLVLSSKLKKIMDKSWAAVEDRITHGDYIFNQKTGEMMRKEVSLRDVSKVAMDISTLTQKLDMAENFTVAADAVEDKINKLAKAFSDFAKGKHLETGPVEDAVIVPEEEALDLDNPTPIS